jgi:DNA adenine methylase
MVNPVVKWVGGKAKVVPQILPHMPERYTRYLEPFVGGGSVWLAVEPSVPTILNDLNFHLVDLYRAIQTDPQALMDAVDALGTDVTEIGYQQVRSFEPADLFRRAARTLWLNKTCFNGLWRENRKGGFNSPWNHNPKVNPYNRENIEAFSQRLAGVKLQDGDWRLVFGGVQEGDLVYCDPPYDPLTPTSNFTAYQSAGFTWQDQLDLYQAAKDAQSRGATVLISNSSSQRILDLYGKDAQIITARRAINCKGAGRGEVAESLLVLR